MAAGGTSIPWLWNILANLWVHLRLGPSDSAEKRRRRQRGRDASEAG
jgi:hypothetical protein